MTHDYKAALKMIEDFGATTTNEQYRAVIHALKLADKVTGEPSEGMLNSDFQELEMDDYCAGIVFKAMIAQAQREIEE